MIWSVIMLFAQDSPRLWAFLPNGTGRNAHHDGLISMMRLHD